MAGLLRGMTRTAAIVGTANAVTHRQQTKFAQQAAAQPQPAAAPIAPVVPTATIDTDNQIAQLQQLAQLKDQGILTQSEFDAKKQQILGL